VGVGSRRRWCIACCSCRSPSVRGCGPRRVRHRLDLDAPRHHGPANQALLHFSSPLWLSWMGDYLPHVRLEPVLGPAAALMQWSSAIDAVPRGDAAGRQSAQSAERNSRCRLCRHDARTQRTCASSFACTSRRWPASPARGGGTCSPNPPHRDFRRFIGFTCFWHFRGDGGSAVHQPIPAHRHTRWTSSTC